MRQFEPVVLASASPVRRRLLENAGIKIEVDPADVDEGAIRTNGLRNGLLPEDIAVLLAIAKAEVVGRRRAGEAIVAADQLLACGAELFEKPSNRMAAHRQLQSLAGRSHDLHSAVVLWHGNSVVWQHVETASLRMRPLTDDHIDAYLACACDDVLGSVGAYQLEGLGVRLFEETRGDYFTVLGLPLLPLLEALRRAGIAD